MKILIGIFIIILYASYMFVVIENKWSDTSILCDNVVSVGELK